MKALSNIILLLTVLNFEFSAVKWRAFSDLSFWNSLNLALLNPKIAVEVIHAFYKHKYGMFYIEINSDSRKNWGNIIFVLLKPEHSNCNSEHYIVYY